MATQYTAGLSVGQVLPAGTMNSIGAAWETWTPTITASSGTFTTTTVNAARYGRIQKIIFGLLDVSVTSIGTASGTMRFTLPVTAFRAIYVPGSWRDINVSGETGVFAMDGTTICELRRYDNGAYLTNGDRYVGSFVYEAA